jgi:hypothetical protein
MIIYFFEWLQDNLHDRLAFQQGLVSSLALPHDDSMEQFVLQYREYTASSSTLLAIDRRNACGNQLLIFHDIDSVLWVERGIVAWGIRFGHCRFDVSLLLLPAIYTKRLAMGFLHVTWDGSPQRKKRPVTLPADVDDSQPSRSIP